MIGYSLLLALALVVSAPWWMLRMLTRGQYREGLAGRLGRLPHSLDETIAQRETAQGLVWLHAVSVGEVLAAERLVGELRTALPGYLVVVSTTTATGQRVAREKLGVPVFFYPLDFAFAVRRYLRALRPTLFVTVESEFWPRMLVECEHAGIPVAVVNARISDRSFPRYLRLRLLWRPLLRKVSLFLVSGLETLERLLELGCVPERVGSVGNLKYDLLPARGGAALERIREAAGKRRIVVAGSTVSGDSWNEEELVLQAMDFVWASQPGVLLVLAPRQPLRFDYAYGLASEHGATRLSELAKGGELPAQGHTLVLDTLGDLASVYALADVAFLGGSLVRRGGHNPLEAARFGVPIVMGPYVENFREIVARLRGKRAIRIVAAGDERKFAANAHEELGKALVQLLNDDEGLGGRAKQVFEAQSGAVERTVVELCRLIGKVS